MPRASEKIADIQIDCEPRKNKLTLCFASAVGAAYMRRHGI